MQAMLGSTASVGFATRWQLPSPPFPVKSTHLQGFCATQMSSGNVVSSGIQAFPSSTISNSGATTTHCRNHLPGILLHQSPIDVPS